MKQRKTTKTQPKKVAMGETHAMAGTSIDNTNKLPSGHTKMSTNYTIHSSALQQARKAKKPAPRSNSKENPLTNSRKLPNSKSSKKLKINLQPDHRAAPPEQSYRQYCLIDENFVPIINADDQKYMQDILAQTATTSCDFNYQFRSPSPQRIVPPLRKRAISNSRHSQEESGLKIVEKIDIATSAIKIPQPQSTSIQILAVPESVEIGLQYSARPEDKKQSVIEEAVQAAEGESLSDLLLKLEFSHLGDQKSLASLTSNEKEHFTQLLETLATKLRGKPQMKPITFPSDSSPEPSSTYSLPAQEENFKVNYQQLEHQVVLREYHQMNWIQSGHEYAEEEVQTSLYSSISFLCHLFCFVEMHYSEKFVEMIQKFYGHTCAEKYRRITRGIPIIPDYRFRVINQGIFLEFINESNYSSPLEIAHLKAIFDAFNEHLQQYRPFFSGNGQQFPWALRMFVSMSEYSINQDSLQIIFMQAKEKMVEWCSLLCGLLVNHEEKALLPGNPLQLKRIQREDKMLQLWVKEENFEKDGIELYSTQALHDAAELIYQQLLIECAKDLL